jgi:hypothetical protein
MSTSSRSPSQSRKRSQSRSPSQSRKQERERSPLLNEIEKKRERSPLLNEIEQKRFDQDRKRQFKEYQNALEKELVVVHPDDIPINRIIKGHEVNESLGLPPEHGVMQFMKKPKTPKKRSNSFGGKSKKIRKTSLGRRRLTVRNRVVGR